MKKMNATELRDDLSETLNRVTYQGERVILQRRGKDIAALVSMADYQLIEAAEDKIDRVAAQKALAEINE